MDCRNIEKLVDAASSYVGSGFASQAGDIRYTTSKQTGRYDEGIRVVPRNITVDAGMFFSFKHPVPYLPPQWSAHIHPEGQMYFYKDAAIRVVTEANINDPKVLAKVEYWVQVVEKLLPQKGLALTENVELLIQIDGNDCFHYFIDHQSQTIFWMEPLETDEMGIEPVASPAHLRLALQEFYWTHVEFFPAHVKDLAPNVLEELIGVFSHALAGN
ncbi:hypothetical protein H0H87_011249 [Tephrocybe sp. NHM501043]|nr:hypothetical protein H0H87_011249 [Tephrocybe sp. NHM501043]